MEELQPRVQAMPATGEERLSFWVLGDLHYQAQTEWQAVHTPRMSQMFRDLHQLWTQEGEPTFCVSPGDIVEMAGPEHYQLAGEQLRRNLDPVPFYPGLGNHELWSNGGGESEAELVEDFTTFWSRPPRYYWVQGEVICIMLDAVGYGVPEFSRETLSFLETALAKHPRHIAILFAHCPLYDTVLTREVHGEDYHSREAFFSIANSAEVRELLARHSNACLYFSGHTHSGWQAPQLVKTEILGEHPVTFVNISSPWYTGRHHGAEWLEDQRRYRYRPDQPDCIVSFSVSVARTGIHLRLRDHQKANWLAEWRLPAR